MITHAKLLELLDYDSATGHFTNKVTRQRAPVGARSGSPSGHGYRKLCLDGCRYYEHHLAWFYETGEWPEELDHKDGNRSNNAIENLRLSTRTQNNFNSVRPTGVSGLRGAYWNPRTSSWFSKIQVDGQAIWLGTFPTPEEAALAYNAAVGEFGVHNRESHQLNQE